MVIHRKCEEPCVLSGYVGRMTDNVTCEVIGIKEALRLIVERVREDGNINAAYVFTDCQSAIDIFTKQSNAYRNLEDFRLIWRCLKILRGLNVDLKLVWIPGHAEINGNELADKAAKNGCSLGDADNNEGIETISEQVLFGWVKEKLLKRWGEMWTRSPGGSWTRCLLRDVGKKLFFPRDRNSGMSYARSLLNNAAVADNMHRMGLADSPDCSCGDARETVEHVLMECQLESVARNRLLMEIGDVWMNNKKAGGLQFNLETILNPFANHRLNQLESQQIMDYVFAFLGLSQKSFR